MAYDGSGEYREDGDEVWEGDGEGRIVGHERVATWAEETRRYRRNPGGWWWGALLGVPAVLAAAGLAFGGSGTTANSGSAGKTSPTSTTSSAGQTSGSSSTSSSSDSSSSSSSGSPATGDGTVASSAFAITRAGDAVTVRADVPDEAAKTALIDSVKSALGVSTVVDKVTVAASAAGPAPAAVGSALAALKDAGNFGLAWDLKSLVATGTVAAEDAKTKVADALAAAWPGASVSNGITVGTDAAAACANLGDSIKVALADTKITFVKYGTDPNDDSVAVLKRVAAMASKCADARLTVTGYTDSSGSDAENKRLSEQRAQSVRKVLVSNGVADTQVTAVGKGEADPIASNSTPAGIAANRRVEITVN